MHVLQLTPFFTPNVGGVETHLDDLVSELSKNQIESTVITYIPLSTKVAAPRYEKKGDYVNIIRLPWFRGLFYKLEPYPILDFLYLTPGLFFYTLYFLIKNGKKIDIIHAHGLNCALIGGILKVFFSKPLVVSTHATYDLVPKSNLSKLVKLCFFNADKILSLSENSKKELVKIGIPANLIEPFVYWVDIEKFKPDKINESKINLNLSKYKVVLFVGRLIKKKGILEFIKAATKCTTKDYIFVICGTGDLDALVNEQSDSSKNILYVGRVVNDTIAQYYKAADVLVVPSTHDEGFGRVILESLACGTPVVGSNRGGIPEAMDNSVGKLIDVTPKNILSAVNEILNRSDYSLLRTNCRKYAEKRYSNKNIELFINTYTNLLKNAKN